MYFTLTDVVVLLAAFVVMVQFWHIRAITEIANRYLAAFCEERNLQLLSVARFKTKIGMHRGKPDWHTTFAFEFSGNGEDKYTGKLIMKGKQAIDVDMPAYRV